MKRVDTSAFLEVTKRLLSSGCRVRFRATGTSMHPTIRDGEMLDVECVDVSSVRQGDVLLYLHGRRPIVHRVVQIYREGSAISGFLLCGDGKTACDAPIEPHQVLGRVIVPAKPFSRWVLDYLDSCFGPLRNHSLAPRTIRQT